MTRFQTKFSRVGFAISSFMLSFALTSCADHPLQSPVESGDSTLFTSDVGPIDHENINDGGVQSTPTQTTANGNKTTHSSIKTPKGAEYGAPTGTTGGSGTTP